MVNLTQPDGSVQARYQYDAWGNKRNEVGSSFNRFSFTGYEEDTETGLLYAKARFYDPESGRFLSHDPLEGEIDTPPSLHRYLYVFANPTVFIDPTGLAPCFSDNPGECIGQSEEDRERAQAVIGQSNLESVRTSSNTTVGESRDPEQQGIADRQSRHRAAIKARERADGGVDNDPAVAAAVERSFRNGVSLNDEDEGSSSAVSRLEDATLARERVLQQIQVGADVTRWIDKFLPSNAVEGAVYLTGGTAVAFAGGKFVKITKAAYDRTKARQAAKGRLGNGSFDGESDFGTLNQAPSSRTNLQGQAANSVDPQGLGRAGEAVSSDLTGLPKNTTRIPSASGQRAYRVPDHMSINQRYIAETKNVNRQSLTSQILDDKAHVLRGGGPGRVDVIIDSRSQTSTPLLREHLNPGSPIKLRSGNLNGR